MVRDELSMGAFLVLLELGGSTEQQVRQLPTRIEIKKQNKNKTLSRPRRKRVGVACLSH